MATWTDPPTLTAGVSFYTAALYNTYTRDNLLAMSQWSSYTPTITQDAAHTTSIAKTTTYCKYQYFGKTLKVRFKLTITGSGTAAQALTFSLPSGILAATTVLDEGHGAFYDSSATTTYPVIIQTLTTSQVVFYRSDQSFTAFVGGDPNVEVANGDIIRGIFELETA